MSKAINKCMIKVDSLLFNIFVYGLEEKLTHICSSQRGANKCNASVNLFRNVYWKSLVFHELLKTTFACSVLQSAICILWCRVFSLSRTAIINVHHHLHHMMRMMRHISLPRVVGMQNSVILQACVGKVLYRDTQFVCRNVMKDVVTVTTKKTINNCPM